MESHAPSINIIDVANDEEVDETPRELLHSRLMLVNANKTSSVWQYIAMVKDEPITHSVIQYVYYCLLCLKKCPTKFLDSLVTIYYRTTGNTHKHIIFTHLSLHLARKRQSLEPKQMILISTNNICAFIESDNNTIIEHIHALVA